MRLESLTWWLLSHHPCPPYGQAACAWDFLSPKHPGHGTSPRDSDRVDRTGRSGPLGEHLRRATFTCTRCLWSGGTAARELFQPRKTWGKRTKVPGERVNTATATGPCSTRGRCAQRSADACAGPWAAGHGPPGPVALGVRRAEPVGRNAAGAKCRPAGGVGTQCPPGAAPAPHSRGSGQVELLTTLDVVHQVPAVEVLHHEEEVFLGTETTARPSASSGKQRTRPLLFIWI